MHGLNESIGRISSGPSFTYDKKKNSNNTLSFIKEPLKEILELPEFQEKISNPLKAANYQHSLECQVNDLHQQLGSSERR